MTAREQRRRAREIRAIRRRVAGIIVLLALMSAMVLACAARVWEEGRVSATPTTTTEAEPITTVQVIATAPPAEEEMRTPEPEPVSRYAGIEISDEDVYILACLVYHEARGESFEGQVAVIEVVLNRCLSDYFPDTVEEVVFQKYGDVWQFSPAPYLYTAEPTETQYEAVYTAIAAEEPILPLDTVYFSTEPYNDSIVEVIGNHYFCSIF